MHIENLVTGAQISEVTHKVKPLPPALYAIISQLVYKIILVEYCICHYTIFILITRVIGF